MGRDGWDFVFSIGPIVVGVAAIWLAWWRMKADGRAQAEVMEIRNDQHLKAMRAEIVHKSRQRLLDQIREVTISFIPAVSLVAKRLHEKKVEPFSSEREEKLNAARRGGVPHYHNLFFLIPEDGFSNGHEMRKELELLVELLDLEEEPHKVLKVVEDFRKLVYASLREEQQKLDNIYSRSSMTRET